MRNPAIAQSGPGSYPREAESRRMIRCARVRLMARRGGIWAVALAVAAALCTETALGAAGEPVTPELLAAYRAVMANPSDPAANLRYALVAEQLGEYRKSLTTYERMLVVEPGNRTAQDGLTRMRRKLQPELTQAVLETGIVWERNPHRLGSDVDDGFKSQSSLMVRDERKFGDLRWRTLFSGGLDYYFSDKDLNYGFAGVTTGLLADIAPQLAINPFIGGGVAMFQNRYYYSEGVAGAQIEGALNGAFQTAKARVGYREYAEGFTTRRGFFVDATARLSAPDVFVPGGLLVFTPTARWSGIDGDGLDVNLDAVAPGHYSLWAAEVGYYQRLADWLTAGPTLRVGQTFYRTDIIAPGDDNRVDLTVAPGFSVTLNGILGGQRDIRFDYRYEWINSNDPLHDSQNHMLAAKLVNRF